LIILAKTKSSARVSFGDYFTVAEAAEFLGVSRSTLRNWDRSGKLKASRHPVNHYRLYLKENLESLLRQLQAANPGGKAPEVHKG
jgi:excisionase family DNA binding protein